MKLLLLNQFFHPDHSAVAQLATDLAEDLVNAGHEVTALAARGGYLGGTRPPAKDVWRGVNILRISGTSFGKRSILGRVADYASFIVGSALRLMLLPRFDVVIATTAPPLVASLGAMLRAIKGTRFVYWMQDVYPELAIKFGIMQAGSPPARFFEWIARRTLGSADAVIVLGEAMGDRVRAKGVMPARVHTVPNWADGASVRPVAPEANTFLREQGLEGKRVVIYSGNMGRGHDMETLLGVAREFASTPEVIFVFIGDGAKRREVEAVARQLPSVRLFNYQPRDQLAHSLSGGEVHLVCQDAGTVGLIEPSKLYGVLAAGRPVLFVGPDESEIARTILREGVGEVVGNGDIAGATAALRRLLATAAPMGARARKAFEREYDRSRRTAEIGAIIVSVVAKS